MLILKQAETLGWRLALSGLVHKRFSEWDFEEKGPALFKAYGSALAKSARRMQGKESLPIDDPDLYYSKQKTVSELRLLLRRMRTEFYRRRVSPSEDELIEYFHDTVLDEGDNFIGLKLNLNSWVDFLRQNSTTISSLLLRKRAAPAALFDLWFASAKRLDPETVRQKISELRKSARNFR